MTPLLEKHVNDALEIENNVPAEKHALYMECVNNVTMKQRLEHGTKQEIRDGCMLINGVYMMCGGGE